MRVVRRHLLPLLILAAIIQLPALLIDAAAQQRLGESLLPVMSGLDETTPTFREPTADQWQVIIGGLALVAGASLVGMLMGALAGLGNATAVLADYHGRRVDTGMLLRATLSRAIPAMAAACLATLAVLAVIVGGVALGMASIAFLPGDGGGGLGVFLALVVGVATVVCAVTLLTRLVLTSAIIAGEAGGPIGAIRRSWHLTGQHTWRTFGILLLVTVVVALVGSTIVQLLGALVTDTVAAPMGLAVLSDVLLASVVSLLLSPIGGVVTGVVYLDLRVRRDAWQLVVEPPPV